jgi:hypothetical protein
MLTRWPTGCSCMRVLIMSGGAGGGGDRVRGPQERGARGPWGARADVAGEMRASQRRGRRRARAAGAPGPRAALTQRVRDGVGDADGHAGDGHLLEDAGRRRGLGLGLGQGRPRRRLGGLRLLPHRRQHAIEELAAGYGRHHDCGARWHGAGGAGRGATCGGCLSWRAKAGGKGAAAGVSGAISGGNAPEMELRRAGPQVAARLPVGGCPGRVADVGSHRLLGGRSPRDLGKKARHGTALQNATAPGPRRVRSGAPHGGAAAGGGRGAARKSVPRRTPLGGWAPLPPGPAPHSARAPAYAGERRAALQQRPVCRPAAAPARARARAPGSSAVVLGRRARCARPPPAPGRLQAACPKVDCINWPGPMERPPSPGEPRRRLHALPPPPPPSPSLLAPKARCA